MDKHMATQASELRELMKQRLGVKSSDLAQAFRRAGRRLPKRLRKQGAVLVHAEAHAFHPKLAATIDQQAVAKAFKDIIAHLEKIDVNYERRGRLLRIAAIAAFYFWALIAGGVFWLWWQGHV